MSNWWKWCLVVLVCWPTGLPAQEVDHKEVRRLGNLVQYVGTDRQSDGVHAFVEALGPPARDDDKWFISLVTSRGCAPCAKLKQDFASDPWLKALADPVNPKKSWSHYNVYLAEDQSQAWRFAKLKIDAYPTVLVQPPRSKKYGNPATVVYQGTYTGDPRQLATDITAAIRRYLEKRKPEPQAQGGGTRQKSGSKVSPPFRPPPQDEPQPEPVPVVPDSPDELVQVPPLLPEPEPLPLPPPEPQPPVEPPAPVAVGEEAVIVTDAAQAVDDAAEDRVRQVVAGLRKQRCDRLRVRRTDWEDAQHRYPLSRDELPAVLLMRDGRIEDKLSTRVLPYVETDPQPVTLSDVPWSTVLTLVTGGFSLPAMLTAGVYLYRRLRRKRQETGAILSEATLQQLYQLVQRFLTKPAPPAKS